MWSAAAMPPLFVNETSTSRRQLDDRGILLGMSEWHHAPLHYLSEAGVYCVTAATYLKQLVFHKRKHLDSLQNAFFAFAQKFGWTPQAWSFFPNHYHFVAASPDEPQTLRQFLNELHSSSAR